MRRIVATREELTAAWVDAALQGSLGKAGNRVVSVAVERVGNGMSSECYRIVLDYAEPSATLPPTIIAKLPAIDPTSRATQIKYGIYTSEVGFYRDVAPTIRANIPRSYYAEIDEAGEEFTLLMQDLPQARALDDTIGCTLDDAALAVREAARVHGSRWGDPGLERLGWLNHRSTTTAERMIASLPTTIGAFREQYAGMLEPEYWAFVDRLAEVYPLVLRDRRSPRTIQHGDFRLDNLLFDSSGDAVHILDWGTVTLASGLADIAYFLGTALPGNVRVANEQALLREYFAMLATYPIADYDWAQCWEDYRRFAFLGLYAGVAAPVMVGRSERADRLFLHMVRSFSDQIALLGSFDLWR